MEGDKVSTNYYAEWDDGLRLHIGKSSAGWAFLFRVYPYDPEWDDDPPMGIESGKDWIEIMTGGKIKIVDEYGGPIDPAKMIEWIEARKDTPDPEGDPYKWRDPDGYRCVPWEFC